MDKLGQAYGAGMAGGAFDPVAFIKKPQVILRIVSWVFSIIVFGCITGGSWYHSDGVSKCVYNDSGSTCGFGTFVGVMAFLICTGMLAVDAYFDKISSVQLRKRVVIGDLATSGIFAFFYFISFCVLTNKWANTELSGPRESIDRNNPQAAIAFSFFSILTWVGLTYFAWQRYQQGAANAFAPSYDPNNPGAQPPYGYPQEGSYQEPPFSAANNFGGGAGGGGGAQYQQPTY